ncbi:hypothetical protein GLAREA_01871 [Glarea lozoyensis ATCC 20868]|uniref:Uncharacterized protein n=1 Tax=Glarea lozoyensis (strain ATCC 20868 / MF5171) TaxID=1116229 RepID=S3CL57_GLAL2|nr:uncharacterized protein GLAREA_01871 [Glarea lozoyensis ATCC 20868]EPE25959.1 hypothetical protein GLAREA_01871 [Glarea lozoyensis ATCC 20868]
MARETRSGASYKSPSPPTTSHSKLSASTKNEDEEPQFKRIAFTSDDKANVYENPRSKKWKAFAAEYGPIARAKPTAVLKETRHKNERSSSHHGLIGDVSSTAQATNSSAIILDTWEVQGHYKITNKLEGSNLDTSDFEFSMFYYSHSSPRQLYANFSFESLKKRLMRLAPGPMRRSNFKQFEEMYDLEPGELPAPRNKSWICRWRAADGGLRLGTPVGGEGDRNYEFVFEHRPANSTCDFTGIDVEFGIIYNDNPLIFHGTKVANLTTETADDVTEKVGRYF